MRRRAAIVVAGVAAFASLASASAIAAPRASVVSTMGVDAPWIVGWNEAAVTLDNTGLPAFSGTVSVRPRFHYGARSGADLVSVDVTLAAGEGARVLLPFHLEPGVAVDVVVDDGSGSVDTKPVALGVTQPAESTALIVEIRSDGPRGDKLILKPEPSDEDPDGDTPPTKGPKKKPVATPPPTWTSANVQVHSIAFAGETRDAILPDVAAAWRAASLVVVPSDELARIPDRARRALERWVRDGGTIAVHVEREEDLKTEPLTRLLSGTMRLTTPIDAEELKFSGDGLRREVLTRQGDDADVARFGLGEIWLLRRDPWAKRATDESKRAIFALWERSRDRKQDFLVGAAAIAIPWRDDRDALRSLDPNQTFKPALGVVAVLVAIYAILVGPVSFARARRRGRPLDVLRVGPLLAIVMFVVLVAIGRIGKGGGGRARRLEIVDIASGATSGGCARWEATLVDDPSRIRRRATEPIDVLRVVEPNDDAVPTAVERDGLSIKGVRARPWQTVVVEEIGAREVPGGITLEGNGGALALVNHTPWTLEHVVLHPDGATVRSRYFRRVAPGARVESRDGLIVARRPVPEGFEPGNPSPMAENADPISRDALESIGALVQAWSSISFPPLDPLPTSEPLATMIVFGVGGNVGGLKADRDVTYLRVVGAPPADATKAKENPLRPKGKEVEL
jgi:hypothetical protein